MAGVLEWALRTTRCSQLMACSAGCAGTFVSLLSGTSYIYLPLCITANLALNVYMGLT